MVTSSQNENFKALITKKSEKSKHNIIYVLFLLLDLIAFLEISHINEEH